MNDYTSNYANLKVQVEKGENVTPYTKYEPDTSINVYNGNEYVPIPLGNEQEVSDEYSTSQTIPYSCNYSNNFFGQVIWTNPNPSSSFVNQTITVDDMTNFKYIEIFYKKTWLLKWGISVPGAFLVLLYFWAVHYSVRALNWVFPDYGRQSAGGRFADSFLLVVFSAMCLISGMISLFVKINDYDRFRRIQFIVTTVSAVATVCIVLILEKQFPSYEFIVM